MNRSHRIAIAAAAVFVIAACGGDDDSSDATAANSAPSSATSADSAPDEPTASEGTATSTVGSDAPAGEQGGVFRWGTTSIPSAMDPTQAGSDANVAWLTPVYDNLIRAGVDGELEPGLATEWALSDDGLTFELTLREGVQFQDGTPFDGEAVAANLDHARADDSLLAPVFRVIDSIEVVDETHVRLHLARPGGDLPEILRGYGGMMVSPTSLEAGTTATEPVGAGPFRVTSITDSLVTYERWDGYWDDDSILLDGMEVTIMTDDSARLNALRSGQLDATFIRPNQVAEAESAGLVTTVGPRVFTYGLYLNVADERFADPDVRRALSMAIDRPSISTFVYDDGCAPTAQLFPEQYWAYNDEVDDEQWMTFDPDAARDLIAAAAPEGLEMTISTPSITNYQRLAEVLQEQFTEIGVSVQVEALDSAELNARVRSGDYVSAVSPFYSANPDPAAFAAQFYASEAGGTDFLVPEVADAVAASRLTIDRDERAAALGDITAAMLEFGTPLVPVCIPDMVFAAQSNVNGLAVPLLGNYDFRHVSFAS